MIGAAAAIDAAVFTCYVALCNPWRLLHSPWYATQQRKAVDDPQLYHNLSTRPRATSSTDLRALLRAQLGGRVHGLGLS